MLSLLSWGWNPFCLDKVCKDGRKPCQEGQVLLFPMRLALVSEQNEELSHYVTESCEVDPLSSFTDGSEATWLDSGQTTSNWGLDPDPGPSGHPPLPPGSFSFLSPLSTFPHTQQEPLGKIQKASTAWDGLLGRRSWNTGSLCWSVIEIETPNTREHEAALFSPRTETKRWPRLGQSDFLRSVSTHLKCFPWTQKWSNVILQPGAETFWTF